MICFEKSRMDSTRDTLFIWPLLLKLIFIFQFHISISEQQYWSSLLGGVNDTGTVNAILGTPMNVLYFGGNFQGIDADAVGSNSISNAGNIVMWNLTSSSWSTLQSGVNGEVNCLAYDSKNNFLYVGGFFITLGDGTNVNNIAMWDGLNWNALKTGIRSSNNFHGGVYALAFDSNSNKLYVGGEFSEAGNLTNVGNIAVWNGTNWKSMRNGTNCGVFALVFNPNSSLLYVGGEFSKAGNISNLKNIAMWNGTRWFSLGNGTNGAVRTIGFNQNNNTLYVGGYFPKTTNASAIRNIAMWNGSNWNSIQKGVQ